MDPPSTGLLEIRVFFPFCVDILCPNPCTCVYTGCVSTDSVTVNEIAILCAVELHMGLKFGGHWN